MPTPELCHLTIPPLKPCPPHAIFYQPMGITYGPGGILYVADGRNYRIRKIDIATRTVSALA